MTLRSWVYGVVIMKGPLLQTAHPNIKAVDESQKILQKLM